MPLLLLKQAGYHAGQRTRYFMLHARMKLCTNMNPPQGYLVICVIVCIPFCRVFPGIYLKGVDNGGGGGGGGGNIKQKKACAGTSSYALLVCLCSICTWYIIVKPLSDNK